MAHLLKAETATIVIYEIAPRDGFIEIQCDIINGMVPTYYQVNLINTITGDAITGDLIAPFSTNFTSDFGPTAGTYTLQVNALFGSGYFEYSEIITINPTSSQPINIGPPLIEFDPLCPGAPGKIWIHDVTGGSDPNNNWQNFNLFYDGIFTKFYINFISSLYAYN